MSRRNTSYCGSSSGNAKRFKFLKEFVADFLSWLPEEQDEHIHIKKRHSQLTDDDISEAASCKNYRAVISSHQCRIGKKNLKATGKLLEKVIPTINRCRDFESLHENVENTISFRSGIGPLAVYDISVRLGKMKGLSPTLVYLHAGTREGASFILDTIKGNAYSKKAFPRELQVLTPDQIETFLCVYKNDLKRLKLTGKL